MMDESGEPVAASFPGTLPSTSLLPPSPMATDEVAPAEPSVVPKSSPATDGKILPVVRYDDPVLRKAGRPVGEVNAELRAFAANMLATMYAAHGIGLAAQQVGVPQQVTVVDVSVVNQEERPSGMFIGGAAVNPLEFMPMTLLNPRVDPVGPERDTASEGCLSFPEIHGDVRRPVRVRVRARTLDGRDLDFEATGLLGRAIQHEVDHLGGVLFIDRMSRASRVSLAGRLKRLQRETRGE